MCIRDRHYHLLFLDNPVGTGFSFTGSEDGYATNQTQVGDELVSALSQFFTVYPSLRSNDFYVPGESYAGKWVPTAAFAIHEYNKNAKNKINLKGISIGDGAMDPPSQLGAGKFGDLLFNLGMIGTSTPFTQKIAHTHIQTPTRNKSLTSIVKE